MVEEAIRGVIRRGVMCQHVFVEELKTKTKIKWMLHIFQDYSRIDIQQWILPLPN